MDGAVPRSVAERLRETELRHEIRVLGQQIATLAQRYIVVTVRIEHRPKRTFLVTGVDEAHRSHLWRDCCEC
jgi:hypothetical protein